MDDSSLTRMLKVLEVLEEHDTVSFDRLLKRLGYSRSTLYRYLKVLADTGFVTSPAETAYGLGPRIIELDHKIRMRDALITASRPAMRELVKGEPSVALLCRRYRDKVLCIHQETSAVAFHSHFERGLARPIFRGAASRVILAFLPNRTIAAMFRKHAKAFRDAGLGASLNDIQRNLQRIRKHGWDTTEGQVTPGVTGIAAPVLNSKEQVIGSLSLTIPRTGLTTNRIAKIAERVSFAAAIVTRREGVA